MRISRAIIVFILVFSLVFTGCATLPSGNDTDTGKEVSVNKEKETAGKTVPEDKTVPKMTKDDEKNVVLFWGCVIAGVVAGIYGIIMLFSYTIRRMPASPAMLQF